MKKFIVIFLLCFTSANLIAQKSTLNNRDLEILVPGKNRPVTSLSGSWDISFDGEKTWQQGQVPASNYTDDEIVFKKTVRISADMLKNHAWHLFFLGVNNQIEVFFNGEYLGKYYGFGTPFTVDIPARAINGEAGTLKIIAKQADYNEKLARTLPFYAQKNYTGILRDVLLVGTKSIWIDNVLPDNEVNSTHTTSVVDLKMLISSDKIVNSEEITPDDKPQVDSLGNPAVSPPGTNAEPSSDDNIEGLYVKIRYIDPVKADTSRFYRSENFILESERTKELTMSLRIDNPTLWSPDNPHLYEFEIELYRNGNLMDEYKLSYGVKSFKAEGNKITLNHKPFNIRACEYIEDSYHTDFTITSKRIRKDLQLLKLLNCNAIYFSNFSPHPLITALCDSMGFVTLISAPVKAVPEKLLELDEIRVSSGNIIDQQMKYYKRNISLGAYNISSFLPENSNITAEFNKKTVEKIRKISDVPVFKTIYIGSDNINTQNVDFLSIRHTSGETNFYKLDTEIKKIISDVKNKPVVFFYGSLCNPKNHNGYADPLSVDYQAYKISQCFKIAGNNNMAGSIVKSFNDYQLQNPIMTTDYYDRELATTGLFSRNRKFRLSFNTVQALFSGETEPLLNSGSLAGDSIVPVLFMVLTLIMIAMLFLLLNRAPRFREYFVRSMTKPYNFYADIRDQRIISSVHTAILAVFISISVAIYFVTCIYINRADETLNFFLTAAIPFNSAREFLFDIIRTPRLFMLLVAGIFFVKLLLVAILIKILAFFIRAKIYFGDTFTMAVWSANPLIILMILNLFNQRIIDANPFAAIIFGAVAVLLMIMMFFRLMKCFSVVFDKHPGIVYTFGIVSVFLLSLIPVLYYYFQYNVFPYFEYIVKVF